MWSAAKEGRAMTNKEKKLLTVVGTVVVLVSVLVLVLLPYVKKWQFYDKVIDQRATRILMLKRQIANKPALEKEIQRMGEMINSSKLFFPVADKAAAESQLLSTVKKMIESAGGQINSVNIVNQQRGSASNSASVKINFTIDNNGLVEILQNLSGSKPLLNVTTARLLPLMQRRARQQEDTGKVRMDMVIEGFFSAGGQS
ncbi:MAG: hypothetical protein CSA45_01475 [Gammaproteobacteria bacterium]|nr:MAG: hypothetical protein CSA45_01475 [Gammaproteobacteria bacterium]